MLPHLITTVAVAFALVALVSFLTHLSRNTGRPPTEGERSAADTMVAVGTDPATGRVVWNTVSGELRSLRAAVEAVRAASVGRADRTDARVDRLVGSLSDRLDADAVRGESALLGLSGTLTRAGRELEQFIFTGEFDTPGPVEPDGGAPGPDQLDPAVIDAALAEVASWQLPTQWPPRPASGPPPAVDYGQADDPAS